MSNPSNDSIELRFESAMNSFGTPATSTNADEKENCIQDLKNALHSLIQASLDEFLKIIGSHQRDSIETNDMLQLLTYFRDRYLEQTNRLLNICKAAHYHAIEKNDARLDDAIAGIPNVTFFSETEQLIEALNLPSTEIYDNEFQSICNRMWNSRNVWLSFLHLNLPHLPRFALHVKDLDG